MSGDLTLDIGGEVSRCLAVSPTFQLLSNWNYYNIYLINEAAALAIQRGFRRQMSSSNARLNNSLINNKFRYLSLHEGQSILKWFCHGYRKAKATVYQVAMFCGSNVAFNVCRQEAVCPRAASGFATLHIASVRAPGTL